MTKFALFAGAIALALPMAVTPAQADNHIEATPELAPIDWYRVMLIKWKPGKGERAHEIIDMFNKVDKTLGMEGSIDIHMGTGEWDSIVALPMRHGIASMGWAKNPENEKWDAEFARQAGGKDKAKALWAEFDSLIASQQRHIGHIDRD